MSSCLCMYEFRSTVCQLAGNTLRLKPASFSELGKNDLTEVWQSAISKRLLFKFVLLNFVFQKRLSSIKSRLSLKGVLHQRLYSFKGHLPPKVVFHQRLSSIKGGLPSKVTFHLRMSFIKGFLSSKIVFHQRSSSIKGCLP